MGILDGWVIGIYEGLYCSTSSYETFSKFSRLFRQICGNSIFAVITTTLISVGVAMMLIHFFIDLADKSGQQNFTMEQMFRSCLKMLIAYMLIARSQEIIQLMVDLGAALAEKISYSNGALSFFSDSENVDRLKGGLDKISPLDGFFYFAKLLIPYLATLLSNVVVYFIAVSNLVELVVRSLFAPVSVADCFQDGERSNGVRALKKILALALQFALVVVICITAGLVLNSIVGTTDLSEITQVLDVGNMGTYSRESTKKFLDALCANKHYLTCFGVTMAKIGMLCKSQALANDIVGVS